MNMKSENAHVLPEQIDRFPKQECEVIPEGIIINEVQLILAEHRFSRNEVTLNNFTVQRKP
ncbi:MAG: hypothetical protein KJ687_08620 [Proteobacteria bacterium]|nr:hypothetical protein [Pseudomonadota bacterium]